MKPKYPDALFAGGGESRREFMRKSGIAPFAAMLIQDDGLAVQPQGAGAKDNVPWYRRTFRWGQTNINEKDPARYDLDWWQKYWKSTRVQGLIINAGGIVAYYPSKYPLQHRAEFLGDRDLFGELVEAARKIGLVVLARMDSNRAHEPFYQAHPDWFATDAAGHPYRAGELYIACVNGPYYEEFVPGILREICARYRPEGFTDNSWSGLDRGSICYCKNCTEKFKAYSEKNLPSGKDWKDHTYRQWIQWSYARRLEIWELNNRVTREAGGPDCLWVGMIGGDVGSQSRSFRDMKRICERARIIMFDDQGRSNAVGFQGNGEMGKRLHGLLGWEKLIPESMAMYQRNPTFRKAAATEPEARMWMIEGFAGTIQPWWHHVGAFQEDRRQFRTAGPIYRWYEANQAFLTNRRPIATAGVIWSQQNTDFYGRDDAEILVSAPYRGINQALIRARIPYLPVHIDHIERDGAGLSLLILPNLAAMSEGQAGAIRRFVERGGSLIASSETSLHDEWGDRRNDFALADILAAHHSGSHQGPERLERTDHSYLRLSPDMAVTEGRSGAAAGPGMSGKRHPVLAGFEETNILPFGGRLEQVAVAKGALVPLTLIPDFPIYPPETSWMRVPRTDIAAVVLSIHKSGGRIAYLAADLDRRFALANLPDHGDLLYNIVRWSLGDNIPLQVEGTGLIDCHLYRQQERLVLHLVNLASAGSWRSPVHELIPVGPFRVRVRAPRGIHPGTVRFLVSGGKGSMAVRQGWMEFEVKSILDHEVVVMA